MKEYKRLKCAADLGNHPDGYVVLRFAEADGGPFNLQPQMDDTGIFLPSRDAPAYRLKLEGDSPDTLERVGKALLALARAQKKDDTDDSDEAE